MVVLTWHYWVVLGLQARQNRVRGRTGQHGVGLVVWESIISFVDNGVHQRAPMPMILNLAGKSSAATLFVAHPFSDLTKFTE